LATSIIETPREGGHFKGRASLRFHSLELSTRPLPLIVDCLV